MCRAPLEFAGYELIDSASDNKISKQPEGTVAEAYLDVSLRLRECTPLSLICTEKIYRILLHITGIMQSVIENINSRLI